MGPGRCRCRGCRFCDDRPVAVRWQDRLTLDRHVSGTSPCVNGTWVTVRQVISRLVDGSTWEDVLRTHPELVADDIRACLAYTRAEEAGEL